MCVTFCSNLGDKIPLKVDGNQCIAGVYSLIHKHPIDFGLIMFSDGNKRICPFLSFREQEVGDGAVIFLCGNIDGFNDRHGKMQHLFKNPSSLDHNHHLEIEKNKLMDIKFCMMEMNKNTGKMYKKLAKTILRQQNPIDDLEYNNDDITPSSEIQNKPLPPFWDKSNEGSSNYCDDIDTQGVMNRLEKPKTTIASQWQW